MPGPFGPGCFCCTSSLCRRALLPDRAGAFTSLSITNFIMIYCLTVSERSSIVPYTSSTGLWQRLQPRCKLLSSPIIKNHPCGQNNPATGVIFYLLFYLCTEPLTRWSHRYFRLLHRRASRHRRAGLPHRKLRRTLRRRSYHCPSGCLHPQC